MLECNQFYSGVAVYPVPLGDLDPVPLYDLDPVQGRRVFSDGVAVCSAGPAGVLHKSVEPSICAAAFTESKVSSYPASQMHLLNFLLLLREIS